MGSLMAPDCRTVCVGTTTQRTRVDLWALDRLCMIAANPIGEAARLMDVLLLKDVPKLGHAGDEVRVADGYARNYLLPRKLAVPLDESARRQAQSIREARQRQLEREQREAQAQAERLEGVAVSVTARAGDQDKLYGSVTAADIAEKLNEQHGIEVDRRRIVLPEPIRELGEREVEIRVAQSAVAHIKVVVEREDQEG